MAIPTALRAGELSPRSKEGPIGFALDVLGAELAEVQRTVDDAEVHPSDILAPMLEPKCPAEASEESDEIVADDANNSPRIKAEVKVPSQRACRSAASC
jgi:hypothetical protein